MCKFAREIAISRLRRRLAALSCTRTSLFLCGVHAYSFRLKHIQADWKSRRLRRVFKCKFRDGAGRRFLASAALIALRRFCADYLNRQGSIITTRDRPNLSKLIRPPPLFVLAKERDRESEEESRLSQGVFAAELSVCVPETSLNRAELAFFNSLRPPEALSHLGAVCTSS